MPPTPYTAHRRTRGISARYRETSPSRPTNKAGDRGTLTSDIVLRERRTMTKRIAAICVAGALSVFMVATPAKADGFSWGHATLNGGPRFGSDDLDLGLG